MAEAETRTTNAGSSVQFRVDYEQIKELPIGKAVYSDAVSAGGHLWRIECFPRGESVADKGEFISIFLTRISKSRSVRARFEVSMIARDGKQSTSDMRRISHTFKINRYNLTNRYGDSRGWCQFLERTAVEEKYLTQRHVTFLCSILVIDDSPIPVPPSDIGTHLGCLLDHADGTDLSFIIDGETFHAHRAVVAARSPVFRAQLFGSMVEATMSSITLHDIEPATFKVMLRFIYTDELPGEDEPVNTSTEMFQNLLAAADMYALDRLKILCAQELWAKVSVDTVAAILGFAETYNCQELKNKCIDFFAVEENFKQAMFTDGYATLLLKFPLIIAELKKKVRAYL